MRQQAKRRQSISARACSECGDPLQLGRKRVAGKLVYACGPACARARKTRRQRTSRRRVRRNLARVRQRGHTS